MEYQQIKILLERYFQGASTLEEEAALRNYFSGSQVDNRLQEYTPLFRLFAREGSREMEAQKVEEMIDRLANTPARRRRLISGSLRWVAGTAASLLLLIGMWWAYQYRQAPDPTASVDWSQYEITDEQEALEVMRGALLKTSKTLQQGAGKAAGQMDRVQEIGKFFK